MNDICQNIESIFWVRDCKMIDCQFDSRAKVANKAGEKCVMHRWKLKKGMNKRKDAQQMLPLVAWFLFRNILHICSCQVETNWLRKDMFLFDPVGNTLFKRQNCVSVSYIRNLSRWMILDDLESGVFLNSEVTGIILSLLGIWYIKFDIFWYVTFLFQFLYFIQ